MMHSDFIQIQKEVAYVFRNAIKHGGKKVLELLLDRDIVGLVEVVIGSNNDKMLELALEMINNLLKAAAGSEWHKRLVLQIEAHGLTSKIEAISKSEGQVLSIPASNILKQLQ